jgi:hypothetical protein
MEESAGGRGIHANSFRPLHREQALQAQSIDRGRPSAPRPRAYDAAVLERTAAFVVVVLAGAVVAIAAVAPESVHSPAEVRAAFAAAGIAVVSAQVLLPGCQPIWVRHWRRLTEPRRPSISCVEAIFEVRGLAVSVYVFPDESFVTPFVAQSRQLRPRFVAARSNVLVLGEPGHSAVDRALDEL